jgi:hypothetical protein
LFLLAAPVRWGGFFVARGVSIVFLKDRRIIPDR